MKPNREQHPGLLSEADMRRAMLYGGAVGIAALFGIEVVRQFKDLKAIANLGAPEVGGKGVQATLVAPNPNSKPATGPTKQPKKELTKPPKDLLQKEVQTFTQSLNLTEEDVDLATRTKADIFGNEFGVTLDTKTGTPLLVTDGRGTWMPAYLKELGRHGAITVGDLTEEPQRKLRSLLGPEFNLGIVPFGWAYAQPNPPPAPFEFGDADYDAGVAQELGINNLRYAAILSGRGGAGINQLPMWLRAKLRSGVSKEELMKDMTTIVQVTMEHLKNRKDPWRFPPEVIVVNEPLTADDPFVGILGREYMDPLYQLAREIYPEAKLMFNMRDAHRSNGPDTKTGLETVQRLKSKGLIDIVGHQMHLNIETLYSKPDDVTKTIVSFDMPSAITEFTISLDGLRMSQPDRWAEQAKVAEKQIGAALKSAKSGVRLITSVSFWGDVDPASPEPWYLEAYMWDSNKNPKPFYYAVRRAIFNHVVI